MKASLQLPSALTVTVITIPVILLGLMLLTIYPKDFNLQNSFTSLRGLSAVTNNNTSSIYKLTGPVSTRPTFRLLIGILTLPDNYERRHMLRLVYSLQTPPPDVVIDVRFVFCNLTTEEQTVLVALEIMKYDDIIILRCPENMNDGKTYTYFASLPELFNEAPTGGGPPYDFVMKVDDDIFFRLPRLVESLKKMPREDLYFGFVIPCDSMDPFHDYMSGMGYAISWDLVQWISKSEIAKKNMKGPEDMMTGAWFRDGHRAKNRYNTKYAMYDIPIPVTSWCTHDLVPDTIAVHKLKDHRMWVKTLKYFNFTEGVEPSKFYHFD